MSTEEWKTEKGKEEGEKGSTKRQDIRDIKQEPTRARPEQNLRMAPFGEVPAEICTPPPHHITTQSASFVPYSFPYALLSFPTDDSEGEREEKSNTPWKCDRCPFATPVAATGGGPSTFFASSSLECALPVVVLADSTLGFFSLSAFFSSKDSSSLEGAVDEVAGDWVDLM